jgi:hypothetical protein
MPAELDFARVTSDLGTYDDQRYSTCCSPCTRPMRDDLVELIASLQTREAAGGDTESS